MRGADVEVEDEDEAGAAVVARVVVGDDGGDLKGATPSTTMNAMGRARAPPRRAIAMTRRRWSGRGWSGACERYCARWEKT